MPEISVTYRGFKISYTSHRDEEVWSVVLPGKKNPETNRQLELVKRAIDRTFRKPFDRISVLVEKRSSGSGWGHSDRFEKAMITSVGIEGELFIVREGQKSAEEANTLYVDTPGNAKIATELEGIEDEITTLRSKASDLERGQYKKREKLLAFDKEALRKKVLGE